MKTIKAIKGNSIYRIMPLIMKQVVFTKKEVQDLSGVSVNVVSNIINQLVRINILVINYKVLFVKSIKKRFELRFIFF